MVQRRRPQIVSKHQTVILFNRLFHDLHYPQIGARDLRMLERLALSRIGSQSLCGRPMISKGLVAERAPVPPRTSKCSASIDRGIPHGDGT